MNNCEQCKSFYLELERLRRLVPNGTYTLNVAHEEEIQRLRSLADSAQAKAADFERDWYEAKSEFGSAMAKMREALRAAEQRELAALAELDEAKAEITRLRWGEEMACENTPNFSCECPGCETARERSTRGETGP